MTTIINSFTIQEHDKLSKFLINYKNFFTKFEGKTLLLGIASKYGVVYYYGTYFLENTYKYKNLLLNSNVFLEDFNYINKNSFIINIKNMEIINLNYFHNNKIYQLSPKELQKEKDILTYTQPEFCRNSIVINTIPCNIHIGINQKWYKY